MFPLSLLSVQRRILFNNIVYCVECSSNQTIVEREVVVMSCESVVSVVSQQILL